MYVVTVSDEKSRNGFAVMPCQHGFTHIVRQFRTDWPLILGLLLAIYLP
jgi:hypothetical protein